MTSTGPGQITGKQLRKVEQTARQSQNTNVYNSSSIYISNINQKKGGSALLLIDPQYDFIDGSLAVPGAKEDCKRIAQFIRDNIDDLQNIYVTLDSHMNFHIAHPCFWVNAKGENPEPFTAITHEDVVKKVWVPVHPHMREWALKYTAALQNPRLPGLDAFTLTIWPVHCRIGTRGHNVDDEIMDALRDWEIRNAAMVHYILKGNNSKTEHYSAFRAEVIVEEDPGTYFNTQLFENLVAHSKIIVCGEAQSHCVNFSVRDLVHAIVSSNDGDLNKAMDKIVLLGNGMSSVPGCEAMGDAFIHDMKNLTKTRGLKIVDVEKGKKANAAGLKQTSVRKTLVEKS